MDSFFPLAPFLLKGNLSRSSSGFDVGVGVGVTEDVRSFPCTRKNRTRNERSPYLRLERVGTCFPICSEARGHAKVVDVVLVFVVVLLLSEIFCEAVLIGMGQWYFGGGMEVRGRSPKGI